MAATEVESSSVTPRADFSWLADRNHVCLPLEGMKGSRQAPVLTKDYGPSISCVAEPFWYEYTRNIIKLLKKNKRALNPHHYMKISLEKTLLILMLNEEMFVQLRLCIISQLCNYTKKSQYKLN